MTDLKFRWAVPTDYTALGDVMFDAVRFGPSLYDSVQREVWMPEPRKGEAWTQRLTVQHIIIAKTRSEIVGFMSLSQNGYVDFAYIRPRYQGTGLFRRLCRQVEIKAGQLKLKRLTTHASLMAQPAFAVVGFTVIEPETVDIKGVSFERFAMQKAL